MNIFKGWMSTSEDASPTAAKNATAKQISCEGYVQKRGRFVKTWKHRYLVLDGVKLTMSCYESKSAYEQRTESKGEFQLTSIEKETFHGGIMNGNTQPFGFKAIGHAKGKGYTEFCACVTNAKDQAHWIQVGKNALDAKAHPNGNTTEQRTKALLGHDNVKSQAQDQVSEHQANTKELVRHALRDVVEARDIGNEVCTELNGQKELLNKTEKDLDEANVDLDHGDALLTKMKNPMLHPFAHHTRGSHKGGGGGFFHHHQTHDKTRAVATNKIKREGDDLDDLSMLSSALSDLQAQAEEISITTDETSEQMDRIGDKVSAIDDRLKSETKKAKHIITTGNVF